MTDVMIFWNEMWRKGKEGNLNSTSAVLGASESP